MSEIRDGNRLLLIKLWRDEEEESSDEGEDPEDQIKLITYKEA